MGLKLKQSEILNFTFKKSFGPQLLNASIEIVSRPGGAFNPKLLSDLESLALRAVVMDKKQKIADRKSHDDIEQVKKIVDQAFANNKDIAHKQYEIIYDNCVVSWTTTLVDEDGTTVEPNRQNFLDLANMRIPEISDAFEEFMKMIGDNDRIVIDADVNTLKN